MNLIQALNVKEFKLSGNILTAQMELNDFHAQPQGFVNGGAMLALAEIVCGQASNLLLGENGFSVGQSITAHHLKSKPCQGTLFVQAKLLHQGKRSHVWELSLSDEEENLISRITVCNAIMSR